MGRGSELLAAIAANGCVIAPDVHDLMTAQLAAELGFDAVYLGSFASAVTRWGQPDQSLISIDQLIEHARHVADSIDIPLVLDFEDGGVNAVACFRNVEAAARAGVAAVQIEDDRPGKGLGADSVAGLDLAVTKIRAANDARADSDMLIIGRTGLLSVGGSVDAVIERCGAFAAAGADLVTPGMLPEDEVDRFLQQVDRPIAGWAFGQRSRADLIDAGMSLAIYPTQTTVVAYEATRSFLEGLRDTGAGLPLLDAIESAQRIMSTNSGAANVELAERYGVGREGDTATG